MKLLTLALLLAGFSICTLSAENAADVARKRAKCHKAGGSIKGRGHEHAGQCRGKKGHMQAYDIPAEMA